MNIIGTYFDFKTRCLIKYGEVFFEEDKKTDKYLKEFIKTYIDTYYNHILNTYYEDKVTKYNDKIILKELKGKKLELIDDLENKDSDEVKLINRSYDYSCLAITIDTISFKRCNKIVDFKNTLRNVLNENKQKVEVTNSKLDKLSNLVKENTIKERKFFAGLKDDSFKVNFYSYRDTKDKYLASLDYDIPQLEKNYTRDIIEKNYKSEIVELNKTLATINLVSANMLRRIITNYEISNYFIELPLSSINTKEELEEIVNSFSNPRVKENIVFIINYNEYINHKSMFKNLTDFKFAICVDFSRMIVIEKRLAEIENFDLFKYVIIDGVKKEDRQLIENYVIKGKEMFMNELSMM